MKALHLKIPPPVIAIACAAVMWLIAENSPVWTIDRRPRWVAAGLLIAIGSIIDLAAIYSILKAGTTVLPWAPRKTSALVQSGIYRISRNPMYLGLACYLGALSVHLAAPWSVAGIILFIIGTTLLQIMPEEQALKETFGREYEDYCRRVRRWL